MPLERVLRRQGDLFDGAVGGGTLFRQPIVVGYDPSSERTWAWGIGARRTPAASSGVEAVTE
jgi:hypothetical protein